jgi:hypothetical protein
MRPRITLVNQTIRSIREREQKFTALVKYECKDNPQLTWQEAKREVKYRIFNKTIGWIQC